MIGELKVEVMEEDWFRDGGIEMVLAMVGKWRTRRGSFRAYRGKTQHYDRSMVKTKPGG